jgi:hypothetical protein
MWTRFIHCLGPRRRLAQEDHHPARRRRRCRPIEPDTATAPGPLKASQPAGLRAPSMTAGIAAQRAPTPRAALCACAPQWTHAAARRSTPTAARRHRHRAGEPAHGTDGGSGCCCVKDLALFDLGPCLARLIEKSLCVCVCALLRDRLCRPGLALGVTGRFIWSGEAQWAGGTPSWRLAVVR